MGDTSKENAAGSFERSDTTQEQFITVNTIEQAVHLERLPNPMAISKGLGKILKYGNDNLYPNKVKSMAQRSQSTSSAIKTLTRFSKGQGFVSPEGSSNINELIVNREGQTLEEILLHAANEKAVLGVALHFNYNILGEILEVQEVSFETVRYKNDFSKIVLCSDWSRVSSYTTKEIKEFYPFDPEKVKEEIAECGSLDKYPGQILYWIPKKKEIYPLATFDSTLDDTQFEHESGVYKLRNIQNGYSANYMLFYPDQITTQLEKQGIINETLASRGAKNTGKTKHIGINASAMQALGSRKMIEEIPRTGIDKLFTKQNEETRFNIFAAFNQPPILNGISKDGMFNQESFLDAFDFYNSITEHDRQQLEKIFNSFLPYSIWGIDKVEIEPLSFISKRGEEKEDVEPIEPVKPKEED